MVLEKIFICIENISVLYIRYSDFIIVQTNIETQITICFLTPYLLISFFIFLTCLVGDDWNLVMEH